MANKEKNKKDNRHFFKDFKAELKKVIWPTPKQVLNSTTAVVVIVLLTAAIVFVLDLTFETLNTQGINRLKNVVTTQENSITENETETQNTTNVTTEGIDITNPTEENIVGNEVDTNTADENENTTVEDTNTVSE